MVKFLIAYRRKKRKQAKCEKIYNEIKRDAREIGYNSKHFFEEEGWWNYGQQIFIGIADRWYDSGLDNIKHAKKLANRLAKNLANEGAEIFIGIGSAYGANIDEIAIVAKKLHTKGARWISLYNKPEFVYNKTLKDIPPDIEIKLLIGS